MSCWAWLRDAPGQYGTKPNALTKHKKKKLMREPEDMGLEPTDVVVAGAPHFWGKGQSKKKLQAR
jgi:hypothetical protein